MNIHVISDPHYYHSNIIDHCGRPFANGYKTDRVIVMNEKMIARWNSRVKKKDLAICLGDFACYSKADEVAYICSRLQGRKVLVRGNHDRKSIHWYLTHGFDFVCDSFTLGNIIFTHRPLYNTNKHILKCYDLNIHGHIHEKATPQEFKNKCFNASVEQTNYFPVKLDHILGKFRLKLKRRLKQGD